MKITESGDAYLYEKFTKEIESEDYDVAVWIKAQTIHYGDKEKAKYEYVKLKVEDAKAQSGLMANEIAPEEDQQASPKSISAGHEDDPCALSIEEKETDSRNKDVILVKSWCSSCRGWVWESPAGTCMRCAAILDFDKFVQTGKPTNPYHSEYAPVWDREGQLVAGNPNAKSGMQNGYRLLHQNPTKSADANLLNWGDSIARPAGQVQQKKRTPKKAPEQPKPKLPKGVMGFNFWLKMAAAFVAFNVFFFLMKSCAMHSAGF